MALIRVLVFFVLTSCAIASPWSWDEIRAGDPAFDSVHLVYRSPHTYPELRLELFRMGTGVEGFLSSVPLRLSSGAEDVMVCLLDSQGSLEERVVLFQGAMRLSLSSQMTERLVQGLLQGEMAELRVEGLSLRFSDPQGFRQVWERRASWWRNIKNPIAS